MEEDNLVYLLDNKIYINLTNKCTNDCIFCIRSIKDDVQGKNLWLKNEDFTSLDVIEQLQKYIQDGSEVVFCGYGEPTLKLDILKEVAAFAKDNYNDVKVRLNTNGHANFVHKRNIAPELVGLVDEVSVSLNSSNDLQYKELSQPKIQCPNPIGVVSEFIMLCSQAGIKTTASVVTGYKNHEIDLEACEKIAKGSGAELKVREWLDSGY